MPQRSPLQRARRPLGLSVHTSLEVQARILEMAAAHLAEARIYDWASRPRKVAGWDSAAAELRRMAAEIRRQGSGT